MDSVREIDLTKFKSEGFSTHLADCVVLTKDKKLLMQKRPDDWHTSPGVLNIFGGHVEKGETVIKGLVRELNEELGAIVKEEEVVFVGAISEDWTDHTEIVHVHFWHDKDGTITGCYEAESREFDTVDEILADPKVMDYAVWALKECQKLKLI